MWPFSAPDNTLRYRKLDEDFAVAGQIAPDKVRMVAEAGFRSIVCVRPDNEEHGQPSFAAVASAAEEAGLQILHIPISAGVGEGALIRMEAALRELPKPILGYCRSGARAGSLYTYVRAAAR